LQQQTYADAALLACENNIIDMSLQQQINSSQEHTIFVILGTQKGSFELTTS
jgi:hypothetical protein